jgi:hypothetical protein
MGAYHYRILSDDPRNYRRRLKRAQRSNAEKRASIEKTLLAAGWIKKDGIWIGAEAQDSNNKSVT